MVTIRFFQEYKVQDTTGRIFKAGEVFTCSWASARHFVNRGAAEIIPTPSLPISKTTTEVKGVKEIPTPVPVPTSAPIPPHPPVPTPKSATSFSSSPTGTLPTEGTSPAKKL